MAALPQSRGTLLANAIIASPKSAVRSSRSYGLRALSSSFDILSSFVIRNSSLLHPIFLPLPLHHLLRPFIHLNLLRPSPHIPLPLPLRRRIKPNLAPRPHHWRGVIQNIHRPMN